MTEPACRANTGRMLTNATKESSGAPADNSRPRIAETEQDGVLHCALSGAWTTRTVALVDAEMRKIERKARGRAMVLDLSKIEKLDTAGAWLIDRLMTSLAQNGVETSIRGQNEAASVLLEAVCEAFRPDHE